MESQLQFSSVVHLDVAPLSTADCFLDKLTNIKKDAYWS